MSRPAKILRLGRWPALAAAVAAIGLAAAAWAYFTATGTSSASAAIGSLSGPSGISTQQNGNDVSISWNAATLSSGGAADGYRVKRSDGTTVCGSPTLVTALTCTDASVPGGTYTYTVTAVY